MALLCISVNKNPPEINKPWAMKSGFITTPGTFVSLGDTMTRQAWSPCIWIGGERLQDNFRMAYGIAVDVDDGETIEGACQKLGSLSYILAPTKSHLIAKNGLTKERFRVFLPTARIIVSAAEYTETCKRYIKLLGGDKCHDAGRFYWPSTHIAAIQETPNKIAVELPAPVKTFVNQPRQPKYSGPILEVFAHNVMADWQKHGGRNNAAYIAAQRLKEAGRADNWAIQFIAQRTDLSKREIETVVRSAWKR